MSRAGRTLIVCLTALALALVVSACGGDTETVTVTEEAQSDTEATDTAATDTEATDTQATDTELTDTETVGSDTEVSDTASDTSSEDQIDATAAVDALLLGVRQKDPNIVCGLLSEDYANKLTGEKEFGIAKCVENLKKANLGAVQKQLNGVEVKDTVVASGGETATVTLSNGETVDLMRDPKDDSRYVITGGLE